MLVRHSQSENLEELCPGGVAADMEDGTATIDKMGLYRAHGEFSENFWDELLYLLALNGYNEIGNR
jgi:hypothetical protein